MNMLLINIAFPGLLVAYSGANQLTTRTVVSVVNELRPMEDVGYKKK